MLDSLLIFFICEFRVESCEVLVKGAAELNLVSDIKRGIPKFLKFGTVFTQTGATYNLFKNDTFTPESVWTRNLTCRNFKEKLYYNDK